MDTIIVEDEASAARQLLQLLEEGFPGITVCAVAGTVERGLDVVKKHQPDLLFLDVNLPDGTGFDLVRGLPEGQRPEIIFVTSEDRYAYQAIQVAALHYLVKPVSADSLTKAMQLAHVRLRQKNSEERLAALMTNLEDGRRPATQRIGIATDRGVEFVTVGEIIYCEGVSGYTRIHIKGRPNILSSYSIGGYRSMLENHNFCAVHKSYLVNMAYVQGVVGGKEIRLADKTLIPVSRRRKESVLQWLRGQR